MSVVSSVIARLKETGSPFALVEGAVDLAAVDTRPPATPAAYVLAAEEASAENTRATGPVLQRMEADIAVVIITDNLTDRVMGEAAGDIEDLKAWVRGKLIGFEPDGADEPMEHVSGQIVKARSGTVWFDDRFAASTYLEEQS
ncbi:phage tail terminator protein [Oricola indica]|uniref:phage tail terminator protein n=1 Tax=Oricola indica TaxID=2872591 RepID=UPI003CCB87CF